VRSAAASFTRLSRGEWWTCWASRLGVEGEVKISVHQPPTCLQRVNQYLLRFVSLLFRGGGSDPAV
jgi:hypothetical protein